jgi:L-aspartate oxidase
MIPSSLFLRTARSRRYLSTDRLLVVGSGVAGSATALIAAERFKIPVTMLFAGQTPEDCNSYWAQGGIIYRNYDPTSGDSVQSLERDIHRAGAGLCDPNAVLKVAMEGPERVRQLLLSDTFAQVPFDKTESGELSLCLGTFLLKEIVSGVVFS